MISDLESPRFTSCSWYPYSLNDNGEVVILFRNKKDSKNSPYYTDFGSTHKECDYSIVHTAVKSFMQKTACLIVPSELEYMQSFEELERKLKEFCSKFLSNTSTLHENDVLNLNLKKSQEIMHALFDESQSVIEIIGETHVAFFYPVSYFKLETLNKVLAENERFLDISFQWISMKVVADPDFS